MTNAVPNKNKPHQTDIKAASKFSKVIVTQVTKKISTESLDATTRIHKSRTVNITCPFDGFKDGLSKSIGDYYTVVFWHEIDTPLDSVNTTTSWKGAASAETDRTARATSVVVPVNVAHSANGAQVTLVFDVPVKRA